MIRMHDGASYEIIFNHKLTIPNKMVLKISQDKRGLFISMVKILDLRKAFLFSPV